MRYSIIFSLLLSLTLTGGIAQAEVELREFADKAQEQRYKVLINELRCLVCQNQNLADSNAELAQDLRKQVYEMLQAGNSNEQITDFMVNRYGDFVLYRPPVKKSTLLLWVGPFLLLIFGVFVLILFIRRQGQQAVSLSEDDQKKAEQLLQAEEKD